MLQRLKQDLKTDLIAGLLVVIPLATTIWLSVVIATWVIGFLTKIPKQLNPFQDLHPIALDLINLAIGLSVPLLSILAIGLMARNFVGRWLLNVGETVLQAIPLAGAIYKTLQQLLETILRDSRNRFSRVVLLEYPRRGVWAIAFVTGTLNTAVTPEFPNAMLSVFIPTSPNPTTGWYAIVAETEVVSLDIPIEDAFKLIISGGLVAPNLKQLAAVMPALQNPNRITVPDLNTSALNTLSTRTTLPSIDTPSGLS